MPFHNAALQSLLDSIIDGKPCSIQADEAERTRVESELRKLPIPLSENQRLAVINAYAHPLSYIQGPPGTGKSHTITAIMLAALLLDKKVLLISHKPAAIQVVRDRVNAVLGSEFGVVVVQGDLETRKLWRGYMQQLIQDARYANFDRQRQTLESLRESIAQLEAEVSDREAQFQRLLAQAKNFYDKNEAFIPLRDDFLQDFERISRAGLERAFSSASPQADLEKCLRALKKARQGFAQGTLIARKDALFSLALYKAMATQLRADYDLLKSRGALYGERYATLLQAFFEVEGHRLPPDSDLSILHHDLRRAASRLNERRTQFLRLAFDLSRHLNAKAHRSDIDAFQKMLYNSSPRLIQEKQSTVNFQNVMTTFPIWACELRYVSRWLPMQSEMFDLVVVDESSQVNLAEVLPAFYRGKSICVVGDDKQLNLASVGLFKLNKTFETLSWQKNFPDIPLDVAKQRKLLVSESSILDFIIAPENQLSVPRITLNEHFRSLPQLARFTSDSFYEDAGGLRVMTELPEHQGKPCFEAIYVAGEREENDKVVPEEIEKTLTLLEDLIWYKTYLSDPLNKLGFTEQNPPSIGVLTFLTDTKNALAYAIGARFGYEHRENHKLFVATTEEFQGNERDIMILVAGLGQNSAFGATHFENPNRFNVATSRAKHFTYFVYGGIPQRAQLVKQYLRHFGYEPNAVPSSPPNASFALRPDRWTYDPTRLLTEFERRIAAHLEAFARENGFHLFNHVESCGYRLAFALYNPRTNQCVALDIDGRDLSASHRRAYHEAQLERAAVLQRAGWKLAHIPYHKWYRNGWLCEDDASGGSAASETFSQILKTLS